jgi:hypothetical protein
VAETAATVLGAGALAMMSINRRLTEQGRMLPPVGPRHRTGGVLLGTGGCLGMPLGVTLIPSY